MDNITTITVYHWLFAFLSGSIPFGYVVARVFGVNIREVGSGNIGATNVLRTLGKKAGALTFILDAVKGLPVLIYANSLGICDIKLSLIAFLVVVGHCFSPFLKGKGGKGVATGFGCFCYLSPLAAILAISIFAVVLYFSRYVSLSSIIAVTSFPLICLYFGETSLLVFGSLTSAIIVLRHFSNIAKLIRGEEHRFKSKA